MAVVQRIRCRVDRVIDHGDHVYSVDLASERRLPAFKPGQFLHLALDEYDPSGFWPESRVFSIASSPASRDSLRIVYSVRGRYTARMEAELAAGKAAWVKLPYGEFVVDPTRDAVLLAGGTGVTAFTAFLEGLPANHPRQVCVFYGARRPELLLYRAALDAVAARVAMVRARYFAETLEPAAGADPAISLGRLSAADALTHARDAASAVFYLSGPPAMLKALQLDLAARGIAPAAIRVDAWE